MINFKEIRQLQEMLSPSGNTAFPVQNPTGAAKQLSFASLYEAVRRVFINGGIEGKDLLDVEVQTDTRVSGDESTVYLETDFKHLSTGAESSDSIPLPVASEVQAGVMNAATYSALRNVISEVDNILGASWLVMANLGANATATAVNNAWVSQTGQQPRDGNTVVNLDSNNELWKFGNYNGTEQWVLTDLSFNLTAFTNAMLGGIVGSLKKYQIFAEADGTGTVNGLDLLESLANANAKNIESEAAARQEADNALQSNINAKQNALTAGSNIQINGNTISATDTVPNDGELRNSGGTKIFSANQSGNTTLSKSDVGLGNVDNAPAQSNTASASSPGYGGTFTAIDSVARNTAGQVTGVNTKTVTMPAQQAIPTSLPPSGNAGGVLSGTYPNPQLAMDRMAFYLTANNSGGYYNQTVDGMFGTDNNRMSGHFTWDANNANNPVSSAIPQTNALVIKHYANYLTGLFLCVDGRAWLGYRNGSSAWTFKTITFSGGDYMKMMRGDGTQSEGFIEVKTQLDVYYDNLSAIPNATKAPSYIISLSADKLNGVIITCNPCENILSYLPIIRDSATAKFTSSTGWKTVDHTGVAGVAGSGSATITLQRKAGNISFTVNNVAAATYASSAGSAVGLTGILGVANGGTGVSTGYATLTSGVTAGSNTTINAQRINISYIGRVVEFIINMTRNSSTGTATCTLPSAVPIPTGFADRSFVVGTSAGNNRMLYLSSRTIEVYNLNAGEQAYCHASYICGG